MSYCKVEGEGGKDQIIFATAEELSGPSKAIINLDDDDEQPGLILPNGDINWECPCLGGMATGPCGVEFRQAFSCFHYSQAEPKGSECYPDFLKMQDCMSQFPELYPQKPIGEDSDLLSSSEDNNNNKNNSKDEISEPAATLSSNNVGENSETGAKEL